MRELAMIVATAFHEPENIDKLFKPTLSETLHQAKTDPTAWEDDQWWVQT